MKRLIIALSLMLAFGVVDASAQSLLKSLKKGAVTELKKQTKKQVEKEAGKQSDKKNNQGSSGQSSQSNSSAGSQSSTKTTSTKQQAQVNNNGPATGKTNGHEWVDLGLPSGTKWATCNVGATKPEQSGNLYAWGEIATKTAYTYANSKTHGKDVGDISGNATYDVATAKWGGSWRMPTKEEFEELLYYCDYDYVQRGNLWGHLFTNPKNGRSIFLPSTGSKENSSKHEYPKVCGLYWTSTPYKSAKENAAHEYHFGAALGEMGTAERCFGFGVRPVTK